MKRLGTLLIVLIAMGMLVATGCSSDHQARHGSKQSPRVYSTPGPQSDAPFHTTDDGWGDLYYTAD
jgi:hypothetical protein